MLEKPRSPEELAVEAGKTARDSAGKLYEVRQKILRHLGQVIVGQEEAVEQILVALLARGHCLIEGVPGLAKTLLVSTLSKLLRLRFSRIQFTPDLMPTDITGSEILEEDPATKSRSFRFIKGPLFAQMILADEINRTPPKTQAALLQAMQEYQVTAGGTTWTLDLPFFVMATQNPIEQEGTYPLPEAQLDRFFVKIKMDYPSASEERRIVNETTGTPIAAPPGVIGEEEIRHFQALARLVPATDSTVDVAVDLVRRTRPLGAEANEAARKWISWGAGPRASQALILAAKARALLAGRVAASIDDVRSMALPVLRHRIVLNFEAQAEGKTPDEIINLLIAK